MLLCKVEQQRLLGRQMRQREGLGTTLPRIAVRFAAVIAFDIEVLAEHPQLSLHRAQVALNSGIRQLAMELLRADFSNAWNALEQLHRELHGFQGIGSCRHFSSSMCCL